MTRDEANAKARALFAASCAADNICHTGPCACIADVAAALIAAHNNALEETAAWYEAAADLWAGEGSVSV